MKQKLEDHYPTTYKVGGALAATAPASRASAMSDVWTEYNKDCYCNSHLPSARHRKVVKTEIHHYTKFSVFCFDVFHCAIFSQTYHFSRKC